MSETWTVKAMRATGRQLHRLCDRVNDPRLEQLERLVVHVEIERAYELVNYLVLRNRRNVL